MMNIVHRKALRRIAQVPPMTHCKLIYALTNTIPFQAIANIRFITLYDKLTNSNNTILKHILRPLFNKKCTITSNNLHYIKSNYPSGYIKNFKSYCTNFHINSINNNINYDTLARIQDLLHMKKYSTDLTLFEINILLEDACIT